MQTVEFTVGHTALPGATVLRCSIEVDPEGKITGYGEITEAVTPPGGKFLVADITGTVRELQIDPFPYTREASMHGSCHPELEPAEEKFTARLLLKPPEWTGVGSFTYGETTVEDVPVRPVKTRHAQPA